MVDVGCCHVPTLALDIINPRQQNSVNALICKWLLRAAVLASGKSILSFDSDSHISSRRLVSMKVN